MNPADKSRPVSAKSARLAMDMPRAHHGIGYGGDPRPENASSPEERIGLPRSPAQFRKMREESRARILRSAVRLFGELGYDGASVRRIAEDAGVAPGLLYNHFDGKEDLLRALFLESMADVHETFAAADSAPTPAGRLEHLLRACVDVLRRNLDFWRLSYGVRMQPAVLALLGNALHGWTAEIRATLARYLGGIGVADPETEARILFAIIDGISQHFVLEPDDYPIDEVIAGVLARYTAAGS